MEIEELNSRLMEERERARRIQAEFADRNVELSAKLRELERCHWQILLRDEEHETLAQAYQKLWSENASLRSERAATNAERDAAKARLEALLDSTSWQLTAPLRKVVRRLRRIVTV